MYTSNCLQPRSSSYCIRPRLPSLFSQISPQPYSQDLQCVVNHPANTNSPILEHVSAEIKWTPAAQKLHAGALEVEPPAASHMY